MLHFTYFLSSAVLSLSCPSAWRYKAETLSKILFPANRSPTDMLHFNLFHKLWFLFLPSSKKNKIRLVCHVSSTKSLPSSSNFNLQFSSCHQIPLNKYLGHLIASTPSALSGHYPPCFMFLFSQYLQKMVNWKYLEKNSNYSFSCLWSNLSDLYCLAALCLSGKIY